MAAAILINELDVAREGDWSFRDSRPRWRHRRHGSVGTFDPFPAYPHRREVVEQAAEHMQERFQPRWDVELYVADREEEGRSNGYSNVHHDGHYVGDEWVQDPPVGLIMLSGKRIPPHPAVTRYLVAHEYGHHVEWMLNQARGAKHIQDDTLIEQYAKMRGLPQPIHHGSGGRWHSAAPEVFACDFRIVVCDVEPDYWPHDGIPHPSEVDGLARWWTDALRSAR